MTDIDDERLEMLIRSGYTKQDMAIFFNQTVKEVEKSIKENKKIQDMFGGI